MKRSLALSLMAGCLLPTGCAHVKEAGQSSANLMKDTTRGATAAASSGFSALANLMPGSRIKVVKVREKDLRELPTGRERAMAYQNTRKSGFWIFGGPVDFQEPTLPEMESQPDGSLLPPKIQ